MVTIDNNETVCDAVTIQSLRQAQDTCARRADACMYHAHNSFSCFFCTELSHILLTYNRFMLSTYIAYLITSHKQNMVNIIDRINWSIISHFIIVFLTWKFVCNLFGVLPALVSYRKISQCMQ